VSGTAGEARRNGDKGKGTDEKPAGMEKTDPPPISARPTLGEVPCQVAFWSDNSFPMKARLNVDHIRPRRYYPELALELGNLQVLCAACNQGKGNKDATDWRR